MDVLQNTHKYFTTFGYCYYTEDGRSAKDYLALTINLFFSLLNLLLHLISIEFIVHHMDQPDESLFGIMQIMAYIFVGGTHFALSTQKKNFYHLFQFSQSFVHESKLKKSWRSSFKSFLINFWILKEFVGKRVQRNYMTRQKKKEHRLQNIFLSTWGVNTTRLCLYRCSISSFSITFWGTVMKTQQRGFWS